jgi:hypothetical protein
VIRNVWPSFSPECWNLVFGRALPEDQMTGFHIAPQRIRGALARSQRSPEETGKEWKWK